MCPALEPGGPKPHQLKIPHFLGEVGAEAAAWATSEFGKDPRPLCTSCVREDKGLALHTPTHVFTRACPRLCA